MNKFTHYGIIVGDARDPRKYKVRLRETKLFWVTKHGVKYRKSSGWSPEEWPIYHLLLDSIEAIENDKNQASV